MASFFEDLGNRMTGVSSQISQKAKDLTQQQSLKQQITQLGEDKKTKLAAIGLMVYNAKKNGEDAALELDELIAGIDEIEKKTAELQDSLNTLRGMIKCPSCGADIPADSKFCAKCGSAVQIKAPAPAEEAKDAAPAAFCPGCGAAVTADMKFCEACGTKLS